MVMNCKPKTLGCRFVGVFLLCMSVHALESGSDCYAQPPVVAGSFDLRVPGLDAPSIARLTQNELVVQDPQGSITRYQRAPRYDTADQRLLGFSSRQAQQVIRWPIDNTGRMQIGALQNGQVQFAWSKMQISGSRLDSIPMALTEVLPPGLNDDNIAGRLGNKGGTSGSAGNVLNLPQMTAMHLAVGNTADRRFLSLRGRDQFGFVNQPSDTESTWYITPVSNNVVRLQQRRQNDWMAIGLGNVPEAAALNSRLGNRRPGIGKGSLGGGFYPRVGAFSSGFRGSTGMFPLSLLPIHNGADQLWRIQNIAKGGYYFESVLYPGMGLTCIPTQGLFLQPFSYDPWQIWWPQVPAFVLPQPQFRSVEQRLIPNQPLPPSTASIINSHTETILVLLADRRNPQKLEKLRIPPRGSERVQLDRDAGATIVETVETMDVFGNWQQQQFDTPIPPSTLYDISVYEEFLQSIAIDRTGKSPNAIEDINYQPRSIGFFLVPPGDELPEQAEFDAYGIAEEAHNPGTVRRMSQRDLDQNKEAISPDPLQELLNKFQKQRGAF